MSNSALRGWLPNGERFVPGQMCAGPDEHGGCAALRAGHGVICAAATWVVPTASGGRRFRFRGPLERCPVTLLSGISAELGADQDSKS
jgi:hypothetical protein